MTAKSASSRHATPSTAIMLRRIDRKLNDLDRRTDDIEAIQRLDHQARSLNNETMKTQAETIRRLLRQHDTLKQMASWPLVESELRAVNAYIAKPLKDLKQGANIFGAAGHKVVPGRGAWSIPTLHVADVPITTAAHPNTVHHVYDDDKGRRCTRCHCLKEAIEASGLDCRVETTHAP